MLTNMVILKLSCTMRAHCVHLGKGRDAMTIVNINVAKTKLCSLVNDVEKNRERVLICRYGRPVAELVPLPRGKRTKIHPDLAAKILADPTLPTIDSRGTIAIPPTASS